MIAKTNTPKRSLPWHPWSWLAVACGTVAWSESAIATPVPTASSWHAQTPADPLDPAEINDIQDLIEDLEAIDDPGTGEEEFDPTPTGAGPQGGLSPGLTIAIPTGFGADGGQIFAGTSFQSSVRGDDAADAGLILGAAFGDSIDAIGVEISYTMASFGENRDFGSGGFNAKVHRQLGSRSAIAAGWNGFLNIGDGNDFEDSPYLAYSTIFRLRDNLNSFGSRLAFTVGIGGGQYRSEEAIEDEVNEIGVFGGVGLRVARPVSLITEWTGQDLAIGLSIVPFKNVPLVLTPALRDVAGTEDEDARFVLGGGISF